MAGGVQFFSNGVSRQMDEGITGGLVNSIARLSHLVACQNMKNILLKDFRSMVDMLKLLKPIIDEAFDSQMLSNEKLIKTCEELDATVNEAREYLECCPLRMSKLCSVLQTESMVLRVQKYAVDLCHVLGELLKTSLYSAHIEHCLQELQCMLQDPTSDLIEGALEDLKQNLMPSPEDIIKLSEKLSLTSNHGLLSESIALEKERIRAQSKKSAEEMDHINNIIALVAHVRLFMAKLEQFGSINGIPIPSHFRCPLSLHVMMDPVIIASGQTYERSFIQKWLDNGLAVCPMTHQSLSHTNLTPNYTVKALISSWCEENNIHQFHSGQSGRYPCPFLGSLTLEDFNHQSSFQGSVWGDSVSGISAECFNRMEKLKNAVSSRSKESIPDHQDEMLTTSAVSLFRFPSESISSAISSVEVSNKLDEASNVLGQVQYSSLSVLSKDLGLLPLLKATQPAISENGYKNESIINSLALDLKADYVTTTYVQKLIDGLSTCDPQLQSEAASQLRLLSKNNDENRVLIAKCGAIIPLISLLNSDVKKVQENAVTALLNLSINVENKMSIADAGAIELLIHVLEAGSTEAQENSAATLFSLSALEKYKIQIGRSHAIKSLVNLLGYGSLRGKKDAASALFNLSIFHENKARIVQAGAVKYLVELMDPITGMADKSVALLANLSTVPEGRLAIAQEGGIPLLIEIIETGSRRGKENAASALFQLCINSHKFCSLVLQEGAVPPLIALSQFGSPRAKEKAQQVLSHFRSQREGTLRKAKS